MAKLIYIWGTEWICIPGFNSHYTQKEHGTVTDEECNHSDEDPSLRWFPMFLRFVTVAISKAAEDNQNSIEKAVVFFFFYKVWQLLLSLYVVRDAKCVAFLFMQCTVETLLPNFDIAFWTE